MADDLRKTELLLLEKSRKSVGRIDGDTTGKRKRGLDKKVEDLGLENFVGDITQKRVVRKSLGVFLDLEKAGKVHIPKGAERYSYTTPSEYGIIHIPVNRLDVVYQTEKATDWDKVENNARKMKANRPIDPVVIGYNYDVHDGHHRLEAAKKVGFTHVPCIVVGKDKDKVARAKEKYRSVWKSEDVKPLLDENLQDEKEAVSSYNHLIEKVGDDKDLKLILEEIRDDEKDHEKILSLVLDFESGNISISELKSKVRKVEEGVSKSLVIDLSKSLLNKAKLVKKRVMVKGKNGKVFSREQWVRPDDSSVQGEHHPDNHTTYHHHEHGIKDMEKNQRAKFPVVHHPVDTLHHRTYLYRPDEEAIKHAEEKYHKGEALPPITIRPDGEVVDGVHLLELAKRNGLTHIPSIVTGSPNLKKQLEDSLKPEVREINGEGDEGTVLNSKKESPTDTHIKNMVTSSEGGEESESVTNVEYYENFTKKRYTKQHLMSLAKEQGIEWNEFSEKSGTKLPENSAILWMRADMAIKKHLKGGNTFDVEYSRKDIRKKMKQEGKSPVEKEFLDLLEKHGGRDEFMEWAREKDIHWKSNRDPAINWMNFKKKIKTMLEQGKMVDGVRTRQGALMAESNLEIPDWIKNKVTTMGKHHGKVAVMARADQLGIEYAKKTKKGEDLPVNSNILWKNCHMAICKYMAQDNAFTIGEQDTKGLVAQEKETKEVVAENGLASTQGHALNIAKEHSMALEEHCKNWTMKALTLDYDLEDDEEAEALYDELMNSVRTADVMIHFDPMEELSNGMTMIDHLSSEGVMKNDLSLGKDIDYDERTGMESWMFGDDYDPKDEHRPIYGVIDVYNRGLNSHPWNGEVALVLKHTTKDRITCSAKSAGTLEYNDVGKMVRSSLDPHQMIYDRWTDKHSSKVEKLKRGNPQRKRIYDTILSGKDSTEDRDFYEAHVHGDVDIAKDVSHILLPEHWQHDSQYEEVHTNMQALGMIYGVPVKYASSKE